MKQKMFFFMLATLLLFFSITGGVNATTVTYSPSIVHKSGALAYEHTKYLSYEIGARVAGSQGEVKGKEYVSSQFERIGYDVEIQDFSYVRRGVQYKSANVIAYKPGKSKQQIIVGAHYDSVSVGKGADDNASGVGVMLEAAEVLKKVNTPYSIVFIAFGAEEVGLQGSNYYVSQMSAEEKANTVGMINLDSLAVGDFMYVYGSPGEDGFIRDQALNIAKKKKLNVTTNPGINNDYPYGTTGDWSDHAPFQAAGIPIANFEATNWNLGAMDGYVQTEKHGGIWHTKNDTLDFIEAEFPGRVQEHLSTFSQLLIETLKFLNKTSTSK